MKKLIFIYMLACSSFVSANEDVLIEDSNQVAQLNAIQSNLDEVSSAVMSCIDSGKEHSVCLCQNEEIIIQFNINVKKLFEDNMVLQKYALVRFKSTDGTGVTQNLRGILKQANSGAPSCT
ncbi:MAG: hypothetical protein COB22_05710 [Cycloclasticus sp.]|nr:MAG: hypothetical protein COB22_05710 [Cycloclasticus sp.]